MGRLYYAKLNVFFGLIGKLLLIALEFIVRAVFIRTLGEELLGINGVFTNVLQVLSLAELGMNNVVCFSFYKPIAEEDKQKIAALIRFYKKVYNYIALMVFLIGIGLLPFIYLFINTDILIPNLRGIYLIFLADTVFSYLFVYKTSLLRADQKGYIAARYEMAGNVIRAVLQILSLIILRNLVIYLMIKVIMNMLINAVTAKKAEKEYVYIESIDSYLGVEEKKNIFNTIKSGFVYKLSGVLLNSTDNILISAIVGTVWVGFLSNYITIISGIGSIYTIIFNNLTASIGNLVEKESAEKRLRVFNILLFISNWFAIVFSICFYSLSDEFISLWIGEKYIMSKSVVLAKTIMLFLSCSLQPLFSYREALGLYRKTKYAMLMAAIINIVLSVIGGVYWGVAGILYASVLAMLTTYVWYEPFVLYKDCFEISSKSYFILRIKEVFILVIGMTGTIYLFNFWEAASWGMWFVKAVVMFVLINLYCLIVYHNNDEFKEWYKMFLGAFRRI